MLPEWDCRHRQSRPRRIDTVTAENVPAQQHLHFLNSDCRIVVDDGMPWLETGGTGPAHKLALGTAIALELLADLGSRDAAIGNWPDHLGEGTRWVDLAIDRFWSFLSDKAGKPADFQWLECVDLEASKRHESRDVDAAPHALVWLTTLECNRACPFCFYDVKPWKNGNPRDAVWSYKAILRTLNEMQQIGTSHLYVTGGEPFLRADLMSILSAATDRRVRPHVATRINVDAKRAAELARIVWGSFTYSLDAGTQRQADALAGRKGFFEEAKHSLKNLCDAGVPVVVNAVATRANTGRFDALAELLCEVGVPRLEISPYVPPVTERRAASALVPTDDQTDLAEEVAILSDRYLGELEIAVGASGSVPETTGQGNQNVCEVGFTELHILPDGRATRCRYLPREPGLIVGNLEHQSLMDIWTGMSLARLNHPTRETYGQTNCESCGGFSACNTRGRCFVSALATNKTLFAPDQFCVAK